MNPFKQARRARGMSQEDVAAATGIARSTIASYEVGQRNATSDSLQLLATLYGVTTDYLLGRESSVNEESRGTDRTDVTSDSLGDAVDILQGLRGRPELAHLVHQLAAHPDQAAVRKIVRMVETLLSNEP